MFLAAAAIALASALSLALADGAHQAEQLSALHSLGSEDPGSLASRSPIPGTS